MPLLRSGVFLIELEKTFQDFIIFEIAWPAIGVGDCVVERAFQARQLDEQSQRGGIEKNDLSWLDVVRDPNRFLVRDAFGKIKVAQLGNGIASRSACLPLAGSIPRVTSPRSRCASLCAISGVQGDPCRPIVNQRC